MVVGMDFIFTTKIGQIILLTSALLIARHFIRMYMVVLIRKAVTSGSREGVASQNKRVDTLVGITGTLLTLALSAIGIFGLLVIFEVNIAALIAGIGAAGVVIGIVAQSLIKDILAGFYILTENQFRVGDVISLSGVTGTVEELSLRATKLRDFNGDLHTIANGTPEVVTNKTHGWSNVNMVIGVGYECDIAAVKKTINDVGLAMKKDENWQHYIIEPIEFLRVDNFGDSAVDIRALGRVEAGQQWVVAGEFRDRLKAAFDKAGIEIPFPQRVVHTKSSKK